MVFGWMVLARRSLQPMATSVFLGEQALAAVRNTTAFASLQAP
jgi:hypothetical protein